jgi:DNA-binding NarL/FixJ family response regulator
MGRRGRWLRAHVDPEDPLTIRQREIVDGIAAGLTNKEIAVRVGVSEDTVKKHLVRLRARSGAPTRRRSSRC